MGLATQTLASSSDGVPHQQTGQRHKDWPETQGRVRALPVVPPAVAGTPMAGRRLPHRAVAVVLAAAQA
jgi:hypothetical protein